MRTDDDLRELFTELADHAPDPARVRRRLAPADQVDAAGARRPRPELRHRLEQGQWPGQRHRLARRLTLVAVLAVLLLTAVVVPSVLSRRTGAPADHRRADEWRMVGRVDPPPGWAVLARGVDRTQEWTELSAVGHSAWYGHADCTVTVYGAGLEPPAGRPTGAAVVVNGHDGSRTPVSERPARVVWGYDHDAVAESSCAGTGTAPADALALARRTTFDTPVDLPVPFRLTTLPRGYRVESLTVVTGVDRTDATVALSSDDGPTLAVTDTDTSVDAGGPAPALVDRLRLGDRQVLFRPEDGVGQLVVRPGRFLQVGPVYGSTGHDQQPPWPGGELDLVLGVLRHLQPAADPTDAETWYPSGDALP